MRLGDEHAVRPEEIENGLDDRMHALDMREAIRSRHDARLPVLALDLGRHRRGEVAHQGRNAAAVGNLADIGRLDAEDPVAAALEVRQQRAVVRADVNDQVRRRELEQRGSLGIKVGEIVPQQLGGAAGVGVLGREDDDGIDGKAELHQLALFAVQEIGREPGLLARDIVHRDHLVDRRHVAEREHAPQRRVPADLTAFDRYACSGAWPPSCTFAPIASWW